MPKLNTPVKIGTCRYLACTVEQLFKVIIIHVGALFLQLIEKISSGEDQEGHLDIYTSST